MSSVLEVKDLTVRYGGVVALKDVSFAVPPATLVGLIGPNGAGKTTLVDAVTGFTRSTGDVRIHDLSLRGKAAHTRARRGLRRTWQHSELFDDLTVRENLTVAAAPPGFWRALGDVVRGSSRPEPSVEVVIDRLSLRALANLPASELTEGQRKLVGVGRALVASPDLLLLDEPAAGLDSTESAALGAVLRDVVERGTSMLLIEHDMSLVMSICDWIVVLDFGQVIAQGTPAEIRQDARVIEAYLGGSAEGVNG